jgi:hypothetical protein
LSAKRKVDWLLVGSILLLAISLAGLALRAMQEYGPLASQ